MTFLPVESPRLGLGLAALGRPGYINLGHGADLADRSVEGLRAQAWAVLDAAWAAGVRYLDTARSYGLGEAFLGGWLAARGLGPGSGARVGSKWGYTYVADWRPDAPTHEVKTHDLPTLTRQWPETLAALGRTPDVYLIHSATLDSGVLENRGVLGRLAELVASGVRVGLSTSGPAQADTLRRALAAQVEGVNPFSVVQATWNVLESSAGPALAEAHAAGWTVVVKEGVANGRLTAHGLTGRGDVPAPVARLAHEHGVTPDAIALAAVLAQPWADVVLSGASTTMQLAQNLAALRLTLPADALHDLNSPPADYWAARSALPWQ
ncbi:aldo/keto reductase [Deinococcus soli (ex Cha et al. 2016)]|uniref:Aldo/keto reductase n=2 Tax=Deinococcus soli (ex Cha et al. 2016) TaxID=1309411 RepID=A0A0F7JLB5_9DEIO|nr:aldo/keto reductase [Deinococcus soli (ex Cha et al. 2016)]AKH17056.1 aldo/keto reductase [Deinococcus soli (ex Cha et al. 2016)]MDR6219916.1 aryl-alcohol dehydrogenase-like predicted oxidoreductase [Deinococcus soli (ex Cha et al. 2016)]MDR6329826.1 aryl-alcohol dehydrogenase-like predicted oxidoreductase [Deinococcus soli (ex Cha et al. 2016)]MDR6752823.1 aryl-alcohol dehydrogenase-like predicted oxidoreductase [Deinococcus soli (ex Cha et al. 2016)]